MNLLGFIMSLVHMQAVHGWLPAYERLVNSQNFFSPYLTQEDLSRLGRHRTQTALFIDYLREHDVRVLSATENIDTFNENDDLIIGFKGLVNDFYARDGSRRVRTGYRQKQKEGIVITPPFGYFKDKNTKRVVIVEEAAETIRLIFTAYNSGCGLKAIARMLNERKCKTPAQMQLEMLNKRLPYTQDGILKKYLWDATMIAHILKRRELCRDTHLPQK